MHIDETDVSSVAEAVTVTDVLRDSAGKIVGIKTDAPDGDIYANVVIAADGVNSLLARRAGLHREIKPSSVALAVSAISTIDIALQSVSSLRSNLGALQNRLSFTINTLAIQEENATSSESAIRDADVAQETIKFTRNQILVSAGTSVLAQANTVPQTALQLLR